MSKYEKLWLFILNNKKDEYKLSFDTVKEILGFTIDHSFLTYKKELLMYGYEIKHISMKNKEILIGRNNEHK